MKNNNEKVNIFDDKEYNIVFKSVGVNTEALQHLLNILNDNELRFIIFMSAYIKGNKDVQYYGDDYINKPLSRFDISDMCDLELIECNKIIDSLIAKNILKIKEYKYNDFDNYTEIVILNTNIFFAANIKKHNENDCIYSSEIDKFSLKAVLTNKKPAVKRSDDERGSSEYQKWRFRALERDNYTCQCCGNKEELEVHHIENYSSNELLRLDLNNAMTLCKDCHSMYRKGSYHYREGTTGNNRQQLDRYIIDKQYNLYKKDNSIVLPNNKNLLWLINNKQLLKNNINYLQSNEFINMFPFLNELIKYDKDKLVNLLKSFDNRIFIDRKFENNPLFYSHYGSEMEIFNTNPCSCSEVLDLINKFLFLDLIGNTNIETETRGCFTVNEYNDKYFINSETKAKYIIENNLYIDGMFIKNDNDIFEIKSEHNVSVIYDLHLLRSDELLVNEIVKTILEKIETQGYICEKEFSYNKIYKDTYKRNHRQITNYFNLKFKKVDSELRKTIDIKEKNDYIVLYK